jgi:DNA-binding SARP family transcriptional activator
MSKELYMNMYKALAELELAEARIKALEAMLLFLVENDSINDSSIDKEVIELLNKK